MGKPHELEVRAALLVEAMRNEIEFRVKYLTREDGSPIGSVILSPEEKLQRWNDPAMRQQIEEKVFATKGLKGLEGYRNEMMREATRQRNAILNNPALGRFGGE